MSGHREQQQLDYKHGKAASTLPQYITLIKEDLVPKLIQEDDPKRRISLGKTITDRLHQLNNIVRPSSIAKEQHRRDIVKILPSSKTLEKNGLSCNLLEESGPAKWLDHERHTDEQITLAIKDYVEALEMEKQLLHEALNRREAIRKEVSLGKDDSDEEKHSNSWENASNSSKSERIALLEGLAKKQDEEVLILQKQLDEGHSKFIHISKSDYEDMLDHVKPCLRKLSEAAELAEMLSSVNKHIKKNKVNNMGTSLRNHVVLIVRLMDKMRDRVEQTTDTLKEMEKEREVCLQLLKVSDNYELSEILSEKLQQWKEDKQNLNQEIQSLRKNIDILAEKNRELMDELQKANANATEAVKITAPKITPRARRSSAPLRPPSARIKVAEKKTSTVITGIQPKIISFGEISSTPVKSATRKKSTSSMYSMGTY